MSDRKNERKRESLDDANELKFDNKIHPIGSRKCYNVHTLPTIFCY